MTPDKRAKLIKETIDKLCRDCMEEDHGEYESYRYLDEAQARPVLEAFAEKLTADYETDLRVLRALYRARESSRAPDRSAFTCTNTASAPEGWSCELPEGHKGPHAAFIGQLDEIRWLEEKK